MRLTGNWLLAAVLVTALSSSSWAAKPPVSASGAWVRWLPDGLPAAGYMTLRNDSGASQRLSVASSPDYLKVMLHRSVRENGVERMIEPDGLDIPPRSSVSLAPGGYHLMLMGGKHPIAPGDSVMLHLSFASGRGLDVRASVKPASATSVESPIQ